MYKHIQLWKLPDNYFGAQYPEYYTVYTKTRDSDYISESNFRIILSRLGGESDTVRIAESSHWLCGWIEIILIHKSNTQALSIAEGLLAEIDEYPILDEDDASQLETERATEAWQALTWQDRADIMREYWLQYRDFHGKFKHLLSAIRGNFAPWGDYGYEPFYE